MSAEARKAIFARLHGAASGLSNNDILRQQWSWPAAPVPQLCADGLEEALLCQVVKNHGTVDCAVDRSAAVKAISHYLYENFRSQRLVAGNDARLAALPWRDGGLLPRFGELAAGELVALSYANLAVAELGAVVTYTGKANPARNTLMPEAHVVLVNCADIVPDTENAWERIALDMEASGSPRGINFIAGPSSTADIEGQLVYGAHGPKAWHVILVGNIPAGALDKARAYA